ncbi:MAG: hypothetical protein K2G25_03565, partial [Oscillospiraceae bacterium]|nr:hypothetical protein [Oscillospiraceae bacterium]
ISYDKNGKEHVYYHDDVDVEIKVTDCFPYSGIKSVEYWVTVNDEETVDGKETIHETYEAESEHQETDKNKSCDEWTENIKIPYNSSDVVLHVKAEDYAGNITSEKLKLDIDKTAPQIEISYDNNNGIQDTDERYYFKNSRTATIKFTERENHFNREDAINSILIMDIYKGDASNTFEWGEWQTIRGTSENHDDDTHTITIRYFGDANYHFDISYTDKAGNKNSSVETGKSVAPYNFTVDMTAPYGIVTAVSAEGRMQTWDSIVNPLSFGFWSKSSIQLSSETWDLISPVKSVEYYKSFSTTALTEEELRNVGNWKNFDSLNFASNEQCTVYLKITDMAGNSAYISTNALIVDDNAPYDEMIPPDISMTAEQAESGIYNNDVTVSVVVNEPLVNDAYSGLKTISYRILNMGQETESGTLYTFDSVAPQYSDLLKTWEGEITVSSEANNSNDVVLEIYAQDNALNSSVERLSLSIDITPPEIAVSFDNNNSHDGLFKSSRTARISIRERNFSKDFVNILATRNDAEYTPTVVWTQSGGTENGDNTIWYADVPFSSDGDYTFSVACTDLAANKSGELQYADDTVLPSEFTVDATSPKINVVFTDEDTSPEGIYYKASRTATITIDELHFNKEKATKGITVKGDNDGESVNTIISDWKDNGSIHTATVKFSQDAKYHLSVAYTDEAGNAGTGFNTDFYIDNIDPELNISVNDKEKFGAYGADSKEEVLPVIQYKDANFDAEQVTIALSGINVEVSDAEVKDDTISFTLTSKSGKSRTWTGKFEDITDNGKICGKILTFEDFPSDVTKNLNNNENDEEKILESKKKDKEFDDIYTFSVSVKDKSGRISNSKNLEKNSLTFSVNRTGSTYDTSEIKSLLGASVQESPEVVISEINPNSLKEYYVTLDKNTKLLKLEKGKDYDVIFTGKETEGYQYTYKIYQSNFEDDGVYSIILHSEDKAGNISENTLDTKNQTIEFIVDKTPPTVAIANLKDDETYYVDDKMSVIMLANDNLKLTEVIVYLDDDKNIYHQWNEQEIEQILKADSSSGEFIFEIEAQPALSSQKHNLTIICKDASGRENEPYLIKGFRVIYNESVKPLIYTGIGGAAVLIISTVVVIARRRKNNGT